MFGLLIIVIYSDSPDKAMSLSSLGYGGGGRRAESGFSDWAGSCGLIKVYKDST